LTSSSLIEAPQVIPREDMSRWRAPCKFTELPENLKKIFRGEVTKHRQRFPNQDNRFYERYAWNHIFKCEKWFRHNNGQWFQANKSCGECAKIAYMPTSYRPTFSMAVNELFAHCKNSSSPVLTSGAGASRSKDHASGDGFSSSKEGESKKMTKGESESEGEGEDESVQRIRAVLDMDADFATKKKLLKALLEDETESDAAESEDEDKVARLKVPAKGARVPSAEPVEIGGVTIPQSRYKAFDEAFRNSGFLADIRKSLKFNA
jgi:hypothetical protein